MKLFQKLMTAMLAGVLAVGMLAGCSGGSGSVNGPVPTSPRPEDPNVLAVYEVIEQKAEKMRLVSAPAYSAEASKLAEVYLNGGTSSEKTAAFNELKATLAEQGLRVSNSSDTGEASKLSVYSGPDAVWTAELGSTNYSLNKRYTDNMVGALVDYHCNSVGIAVKDGKMAIVYVRIIQTPAETN